MATVHLYSADSSSVPDGWERALPRIASYYRSRASDAGIDEPSRRSEFCAGLLLAHVLGVASDDQLVRGASGKPALAAGTPSFNLSHGGDLVVLATSETDVGVDVERIPCALGPMERSAARRVFAPDERDALDRADDNEAPDLFARLWTAKEAVLKALGSGFDVDPRAHPEAMAGWIVNSIRHEGHMIAVAQREPFEIRLVPLDWERLASKGAGERLRGEAGTEAKERGRHA